MQHAYRPSKCGTLRMLPARPQVHEHGELGSACRDPGPVHRAELEGPSLQLALPVIHSCGISGRNPPDRSYFPWYERSKEDGMTDGDRAAPPATDGPGRGLSETIQRFGYSVEYVSDAKERQPSFAYTIGLFAHGYPELLVFGHRLLREPAVEPIRPEHGLPGLGTVSTITCRRSK